MYKYEYGLLFPGETIEEINASIERYLNPKPYEKPTPKKKARK
jgi:hypothetical protein